MNFNVNDALRHRSRKCGNILAVLFILKCTKLFLNFDLKILLAKCFSLIHPRMSNSVEAHTELFTSKY